MALSFAGRAWAAEAAALALAIALCLSACSRRDEPRADRAGREYANLVLVSLSGVRSDHLSCYGYPSDTSPRIDGLAAGGAVLRAITACPRTLGAHASMLTGLLPSAHRAVRAPLGEDIVTLADLLRARGYETAAFTEDEVLEDPGGLGLEFDSFHPRPVTDPDASGAGLEATYGAWRRWFFARTGDAGPFFALLQTDEALSAIGEEPSDRAQDLPESAGTFPRRPPPAADVARLVARYDAGIQRADEFVGRILDDIEASGLTQRTVVVVTADHGVELFEHATAGSRSGSLYRTMVEIPLVIRAPGKIPPGSRPGVVAGGVDILPTVMELLGFLGNVAGDFHGRSLAPVLRGEALPDLPVMTESDIAPDSDATAAADSAAAAAADSAAAAAADSAAAAAADSAAAAATDSAASIERGPWRLILDRNGPALFNIREDPGETGNRAFSEREVGFELLARLRETRYALQPGIHFVLSASSVQDRFRLRVQSAGACRVLIEPARDGGKPAGALKNQELTVEFPKGTRNRHVVLVPDPDTADTRIAILLNGAPIPGSALFIGRSPSPAATEIGPLDATRPDLRVFAPILDVPAVPGARVWSIRPRADDAIRKAPSGPPPADAATPGNR